MKSEVNFTVVPITEAHIVSYHAALDAVAREGKYLAFYDAPPLEDTAAWVRKNIRKGIAQFVAVAENKVVGWCDVSPDGGRPSSAHVGSLGMGIVSEYRGHGIGHALITATMAKARAKGLIRIELSVVENNLPAIALYKKTGFKEEGLQIKAHRNPDGSLVNLVLMGIVFEPETKR